VPSFVGSDDKDGSEKSYDPTKKEVWRVSDGSQGSLINKN
jgi:hypothetical protein